MNDPDVDALRRELAAERGLTEDALPFLDGSTVDELEAQADALVKMLDTNVDRLEREAAVVPDLFTIAAREKARRKQTLAAMFAGRAPQRRDESGRFTGLDGGARATVPLPPPSHDEWLAEVVRRRLADRGFGF